MKPVRNPMLLLAALLLAGCAGGQPTNVGPSKGDEVAHSGYPVFMHGQSVSEADAKGFPTLDSQFQSVAQFRAYRIECESDHKAYLRYGTNDRLLIRDFSSSWKIFSAIRAARPASSAGDPVLLESILLDSSEAINALPQLLISNMKSDNPIVPLVDLAEIWSSQGSIRWQERSSRVTMVTDARLSVDMQDQLRREISEYSKHHDMRQAQPAR